MRSQASGWSPKKTAIRVTLSLEGEVLEVLGDLLYHVQRNWAAIQGALHHCFGQHMPREDACKKLSGQQQRGRENLGAFTADLLRQGYPDFSADVQEELALQAFLRGLCLQ